MGRPKRTTKQRKNPKLDKLEAFLEDFDSEGMDDKEHVDASLLLAINII